MLLLKNYYLKKCYVSIFKFVNVLFNVIIVFSINKDYRECSGFMSMLFNVIVFLVWMGSNRYFGVWVKILKFVGMLFIYLKITSEKVRQKPLLYTSKDPYCLTHRKIVSSNCVCDSCCFDSQDICSHYYDFKVYHKCFTSPAVTT